MSTLDMNWRKSTRSNNNGACVEIRYINGTIQVRDTKDRIGPVLDFTPRDWAAFMIGLRDGQISMG